MKLLRSLIVLLLLTVMVAAQTVTIHTTGKDYVVTYGLGGTLSAPRDVGGGFRVIELPGGMGLLVAGSGADLPFLSISAERAIYTRGSYPSPTGGVEYIPNDPAAYRGTWQSNVIRPWEVIPVLFPNDAYLPPTQARLGYIRAALDRLTNLSVILRYPRMIKFIQFFDDRGVPQRAAFGQTDLGWQLRNWSYTMGGKDYVGWYNGVCPRSAGGFDNSHYDGLLWLAIHYINNPQQSLYQFGLEQAIAHATFGRTWFGPKAGFARYEKGDAFIGEGFQDDAWEKQWSSGLIVWAMITRNPVLEMQIGLMREQLRSSNPDTIWKGYWGARIGSHYLDELLIHWLNQPEEWIVNKARRYLQNCKKWQNADGTWPNLGNNGKAEESPWMQTQLVASIFRWLEQRPDLADAFSPAEAAAAGEAIWAKGSIRTYGGKPMLKYRFLTTEVMPPSMHITAFAVPMLRYMAKFDAAKYGALYAEVEEFVFTFAGTDLAGIVANTPTPLDQIGYRFPREGPGWAKALREYLFAAK